MRKLPFRLKYILITTLLSFVNSQIHASDANLTSNPRYQKCYGEMTAAHKARGFHKKQRALSIKVKETICKAYANGEELEYEGKQDSN